MIVEFGVAKNFGRATSAGNGFGTFISSALSAPSARFLTKRISGPR